MQAFVLLDRVYLTGTLRTFSALLLFFWGRTLGAYNFIFPVSW
jgi:hypothetical protein